MGFDWSNALMGGAVAGPLGLLNGFGGGSGGYLGQGLDYLTGTGQYDPTKQDRASLANQVAMGNAQADAAGKFADTAQNNYNNMTGQLGTQANYLRDLQSGKNSVSAEQLRQSLGQNLAAQQSMAAGAAPQNAAMAARTAARNQASLGAGLAGQQALAGLQERNMATSQLGNMLLGQRGQDVNAALGSRQNAIGGYGQGINAYSNLIQHPQQTQGQQLTALGASLAPALAASDKNLKTDIKDADDESKDVLEKIKPYRYKYKDEGFGKGEQFGPMAQDLEKAGLGHAIVNTKQGKMVDGAKVALSSIGLAAALARRVSKLEASKGSDE